jgi:hypothetical protein
LEYREYSTSKSGCGDPGCYHSGNGDPSGPFLIGVVVLIAFIFGGFISAIKGIYGAGDVALFGGATVAFLATFALTLWALSHFVPLS